MRGTTEARDPGRPAHPPARVPVRGDDHTAGPRRDRPGRRLGGEPRHAAGDLGCRTLLHGRRSGTTRFDRKDSGIQLGRARFALTASLGELWSAHFDASTWDDKDRSPVGVTEAYLQFRPYPRAGYRFRLKAGAFYPPISLENRAAGWESPYTLSYSAINTWLGVEVRTIGLEAQLDWLGTRTRHDFDLGLTGGAFGWNQGEGGGVARERSSCSRATASCCTTGRRRCSDAWGSRARRRWVLPSRSCNSTGMLACTRAWKGAIWIGWCCVFCATTTAPIRASWTSSPAPSPRTRASTARGCASRARRAGRESCSGSTARPRSHLPDSRTRGRSRRSSPCCRSASAGTP